MMRYSLKIYNQCLKLKWLTRIILDLCVLYDFIIFNSQWIEWKNVEIYDIGGGGTRGSS